MLKFNSIFENTDTCADITNLQRIMSSLEIDIVKNTETDSTDSTSSSVTLRKLSLRRNSDICGSNLHKTNRRVISKPKKNAKSGINPTTENEIRKFYLNKKMARLKSTLLETIFENDEDDLIETANNGHEMSTHVTLIGNRKIKRSLSFSIGGQATKTLVQKRRKRIQSVLGGKPKTKKMSMDTFMSRLKSMQQLNPKSDEPEK